MLSYFSGVLYALFHFTLFEQIVLQCERSLTRMSNLEDLMRHISLYFVGLTLLTLVAGTTIPAREKAEPQAGASQAAPSSGYKAEFLAEIAYYEQRYVQLAEAMPAEKYTWRPGEGVRSVGEVFTHIVAANYGLAKALGTAPPAGLDMKGIQGLSTDKAKTVQALKDSFAHFRSAILALGDGDADKAQKMFGRDTTLRGSFILITGHFGEHLGQSIAYARVNGIVPPWTEEQQKQAQKPKP